MGRFFLPIAQIARNLEILEEFLKKCPIVENKNLLVYCIINVINLCFYFASYNPKDIKIISLNKFL